MLGHEGPSGVVAPGAAGAQGAQGQRSRPRGLRPPSVGRQRWVHADSPGRIQHTDVMARRTRKEEQPTTTQPPGSAPGPRTVLGAGYQQRDRRPRGRPGRRGRRSRRCWCAARCARASRSPARCCTCTGSRTTLPDRPRRLLRRARPGVLRPRPAQVRPRRDGPGHTAHYASDLAAYDAELDASLDIVAAEQPGGRSTVVGALDRRPDHAAVAGPPPPGRAPGAAGRAGAQQPVVRPAGQAGDARAAHLGAAGAVAGPPLRELDLPESTVYGSSLHTSGTGEWDYDLDLKPLTGFPVTVGWLNAVRRGHARLHRGLDVGVPSLVLRSDKTHYSTTALRARATGPTPCSTSARSRGGPAAWAARSPWCRSRTPATTCSSRCRTPARRRTPRSAPGSTRTARLLTAGDAPARATA